MVLAAGDAPSLAPTKNANGPSCVHAVMRRTEEKEIKRPMYTNEPLARSCCWIFCNDLETQAVGDAITWKTSAFQLRRHALHDRLFPAAEPLAQARRVALVIECLACGRLEGPLRVCSIRVQ